MTALTQDSSSIPVTRSVLFVPGNHARRVAKALQSGADAVIVDLEDAVPMAEKAAARDIIAQASRYPRACRAYVRINGLSTGIWEPDIAAVVGLPFDGIVVPKAETAEDLQRLDSHLTRVEVGIGLPAGTLELMPIIESARGVWACETLVLATPRVRRLIFGGADYTLDLDLEWTPEEHELSYARARLAHASRLAGVEPPIDTAILQVRDSERFFLSARNARRMGFQGKLCLHPDQIAPCHGVFTPSPAEIDRARGVIAAYEAALRRGTGSIELNGSFIDLPVVLRARRVLALATLCSAADMQGNERQVR